MRLNEAADILGVSVHADLELLKQTYRKMALAWHPDKCSDPRAKEKFQQISIAYTKLITSRSGEEDEDCGSDEEDHHGDADVHEMRAFMSMFMDLVGIFNDDQISPEDAKLPNGMTFGMMFGNNPDHNEDWSTEDDEDGDPEDEDYDTEDGETMWEPMVKHYFHMNLKEPVTQVREFRIPASSDADDDDDEGDRDIDDELDAKRKLRNAKKRADKRRKQREKKLREATLKAEEEERAALVEERSKREQEEALIRRKEQLRRAQEAEDARRRHLCDLVTAGKAEEVIALIEDSSSGIRATERVANGGRSGAGLLHYCVSISSAGGSEGPADSTEVQEGKLRLAKYLLSLRSPSIDLGLLDEDGRTVAHVAAIRDDVGLIDLLTGQNRDHPSDKKGALTDINARCLESGWTPLHYAAAGGMVGACKALIKAGALLNIHAYIPGMVKDSADGKGPTPLELVKLHLARPSNPAPLTAALTAVEAELSEAVRRLDEIRSQREAERSNKEAKAKAEKQRLAAKEQTERELLERKQKQLKERQDRERQREEDDARAAAAAVSEGSSKKKKKKRDKKETPGAASASTLAPAHSASQHQLGQCEHNEIAPITSYAAGSSKPATASAVVAAVTPAAVPAADIVADITSRDEMVDHLLAMGFNEPDCLAAITACGLDVDKAVSWLCDRPTAPAEAPNKANGGAVDVKDTGKMISSVAAKSATSAAIDTDALQKAQKDKEHKEELRRINREWNARVPQQRAEEERKKLEAERQQKELERQKAIQQQLQQQYSMHSMFNPGILSNAQGGYGGHGMPYGPHGMVMMPPPGAIQQGMSQGPVQPGQQGFDDQIFNGGMQPQPQKQQSMMYGGAPFPQHSMGGGMGLSQGRVAGNSVYDQHSYNMSNMQQQQPSHQGGGGMEGMSSSPQSNTPSPGSQHMQSPQYEPHHQMLPGYGMLTGGNGSQTYGGYNSFSQTLNGGEGYGDMPGDEGNEMTDQAEEYVDGAVHLSAGAKPFIPKFATSPAVTAPSVAGSSELGMGALSLPPMSDSSAPWRLESSSQIGLASSWQQSGARGSSLLGGIDGDLSSGVGGNDDDDYNSGMDNMMHMHVPLDILSFDGIGDPMGESNDDLGESLLGRLACGGGSDRRRNRGMLFEHSSLNTSTSIFLDPSRTGDDDEAIISNLISDVIISPRGGSSLSFCDSSFPGES